MMHAKKWLGSFSLLLILNAGAQTQSPAATPETVLITPENPLPAGDTAFRREISHWSEEQLKTKNYKKIKAHPSAAVFPGRLKEGYRFENRTVTVQHQKISAALVPVVSKLNYSSPWRSNMYSTGLYAAPGEYIEVIIPAALKDKGLSVQIGCHSDKLNTWVAGNEAWRRMPILVKTQALKSEKTRIASPFGGLIYITASPREEDWKAKITIRHAVAAPLFELGKTSPAEWEAMLKTNKAPWGELATDNIILTVPDSVLQQVKNPEAVMQLWDLIIKGEMELAQVPQPFYRAQRLVIDEHIGGGFMHSGYPVMVHHSPVRGMLSANVIANPQLLLKSSRGGANWGFFHEIGHNLQNLDWVFGGTTEVSCNFFSLYLFDRLMGGRDDAHSGVSNASTQRAMKNYFAAGVSYDKWRNDPFLALILFRQLQEAFGWEAFKAFFRAYQEMAANDPSGRYARTDGQKRDLWVKTFSRITGRNIGPFFEAWGIPISNEAKQEVAPLTPWMPYNFPPVNGGQGQ